MRPSSSPPAPVPQTYAHTHRATEKGGGQGLRMGRSSSNSSNSSKGDPGLGAQRGSRGRSGGQRAPRPLARRAPAPLHPPAALAPARDSCTDMKRGPRTPKKPMPANQRPAPPSLRPRLAAPSTLARWTPGLTPGPAPLGGWAPSQRPPYGPCCQRAPPKLRDPHPLGPKAVQTLLGARTSEPIVRPGPGDGLQVGFVQVGFAPPFASGCSPSGVLQLPQPGSLQDSGSHLLSPHVWPVAVLLPPGLSIHWP